MTTHINNCYHAPNDLKASLCYLHHRSLLQKQELPGHWKYTFFMSVWNQLHNDDRKEEFKELPGKEAPAENHKPIDGAKKKLHCTRTRTTFIYMIATILR